MFRKINIKILAGLFAVLLAMVVVVEMTDRKKGGRSFKSELVNVDADLVSSIEIYPRTTNGTLIRLFKENDLWKVESEGKTFNADQATAKRLITQLNNMKPQSVAATKNDSWEKFEVTDSLGTRVKLLNGKEVTADVIIGKFSFSQPRNMTSYVRLADDKEVYGVEGMLGSSFNRNINAFRDRTIISSNKADWTKLSFGYPADSSFVLEKKGTEWVIGEVKADSAAVAQYFNSIANLSDGTFADTKPVTPVTHRLTIEGNNMMQKIEIEGFHSDAENIVLGSNLNPGTYFDSSTAAQKIFIGEGSLIK